MRGWVSKQGWGCCGTSVPELSDELPALTECSVQDLVLFNDTIQYNINYGRLDASREEVEEAAKQARGAAVAALDSCTDASPGHRRGSWAAA